MVLFELLKLMRVFLDYLRIEYLWHILIMPPTNRNGISCNPSADGLLEAANGVPSDAVEGSNVGRSKSSRRTHRILKSLLLYGTPAMRRLT